MSERIDWLDDGTAGGSPYSPRFGDRYRSELGGLEQARDVFLGGCGLPAAWAGKRQWRILETGFGLGLNFLVTWQAWRADPQRPQLLHFVSTEAFPASAEDVLRSAATHPDLVPLASELCAQLWGLLPGFHRIALNNGRVLLTLCIGDTKAVLRQQAFAADSVYLDGFSPQKNPDIWDVHTFKAVARCCRRGTRIATWTIARSVRDALAEAGFVVGKVPGIPPKRDNLQGEYNPDWEPKTARPAPLDSEPSSCVVIGAGLAGAAVAASLARRGWQVTVLDAAGTPAAGASGLPAGVLAPHVSPDDSLLSRLSRSGLRITLQQADALLEAGEDWALTGVLEHRIDETRDGLPADWSGELTDNASPWSRRAAASQLASCGLQHSTLALWHAHAGWIKPASLVRAWLQTPGVRWFGHSRAVNLTPVAGGWQVLDGAGKRLAGAALVVVAAAHDSVALAAAVAGAANVALQPIRGQVSWGIHAAPSGDLPAFPVNGHGSLIPHALIDGQDSWLMGASFERDVASPVIKTSDHIDNLQKLKSLLPAAADTLAGEFEPASVHAWAGIRCATPTRIPLLARIAADSAAGEVWVCSGMGSRGLTFAALCGELLAARLHTEPLPLEVRLAEALAH